MTATLRRTQIADEALTPCRTPITGRRRTGQAGDSFSGGSGVRTRPPGEFADFVRICTHCALSRGWRPPKYSKVRGIDGASHTEVRPKPLREGSVQVKEKCSPRRSFDQIT